MHPEGEKTRENPKGAKPTRDFPEFFTRRGAIISRILSQSPRNVIIVTLEEIKLRNQMKWSNHLSSDELVDAMRENVAKSHSSLLSPVTELSLKATERSAYMSGSPSEFDI